jgi:glutathione synthase/RimK-type ligase-like ATP-grasp enzyme
MINIRHQSRMQAGFVGIDIISGSLGFLLFAINVRRHRLG